MCNFDENRTITVQQTSRAALKFRLQRLPQDCQNRCDLLVLEKLRKFYWTKLFPDQGLQLSRDCDKLRPHWEVQRLPSLR